MNQQHLLKEAFTRGYQLAVNSEGEEKTAAGLVSEGLARLPRFLWDQAKAFSGIGAETKLFKAMASPANLIFRNPQVGKDILSFGTVTGALNALQAEPGDRMGAFGRGFATGGFVGGPTWAGSRALGHGILNRAAKSKLLTTSHPEFASMLKQTAPVRGHIPAELDLKKILQDKTAPNVKMDRAAARGLRTVLPFGLPLAATMTIQPHIERAVSDKLFGENPNQPAASTLMGRPYGMTPDYGYGYNMTPPNPYGY